MEGKNFVSRQVTSPDERGRLIWRHRQLQIKSTVHTHTHRRKPHTTSKESLSREAFGVAATEALTTTATCLDRFIEYYRKNFANNSAANRHTPGAKPLRLGTCRRCASQQTEDAARGTEEGRQQCPVSLSILNRFSILLYVSIGPHSPATVLSSSFPLCPRRLVSKASPEWTDVNSLLAELAQNPNGYKTSEKKSRKKSCVERRRRGAGGQGRCPGGTARVRTFGVGIKSSSWS